MTQTALVTELHGEKQAVILVKRESACGHDCVSCGAGCGGGEMISATAENPVGAKKGDVVTVCTSTGRVISSAFVVYILPLLFFFSFYFLAEVFLPWKYSAIIASSVGFIIAVLNVLLFGKRSKDDIVFTILEVVQTELEYGGKNLYN